MSNAARSEGRADVRRAEQVIEQVYFTTSQASRLTGKSPNALRHAVERGQLVPIAYGQRGRHREHQFTRESLDAYMRSSG